MLVLALFSLTLSAVIALVAYRFLQARVSSEMAAVVVATQKLPLGTRLAAEHLQVVSWPRSSLLEGSFSDPKDLVGRGVVVPLSAREPVLESKLAPREAGAGLTSAIPEGMRAVAVKVDPVTGVGGFVLPGTHVDVIVTGSPEERGGKDTSKVILENVRVVTAGTSLQDEDGKPRDVPVVTLLVSPAESQKLALASADGKIQLALRNPLDQRQENPEAVKKEALYRGPSALMEAPPAEGPRPRVRKAVPAATPRPVVTVEVIQGQKRDRLTFEEAQR
jgi:pilus assembly protein CpaB